MFIQNLITTKADSKPEVLKEIQEVLKRNFQIMPINLDVAPKKPRAANIFYKIDARPEIVAENPGNTRILLTESNNQFQNYKSEFFDHLKQVLQILFVYLLLVFSSKTTWTA